MRRVATRTHGLDTFPNSDGHAMVSNLLAMASTLVVPLLLVAMPFVTSSDIHPGVFLCESFGRSVSLLLTACRPHRWRRAALLLAAAGGRASRATWNVALGQVQTVDQTWPHSRLGFVNKWWDALFSSYWHQRNGLLSRQNLYRHKYG